MEQKKTVLIVEDEKNIVDIIRFNLQRTGYNTLEAYDGEAGLAMAREKKPDLILLDVMMPKMMGFDVCRALRAEGDNVPVIILTAREEEEDKILGLEIGADDYITKPFSMRELLARVKANIRRTTMLSAPAAEDNAMSAGGGITINTDSFQVRKNGVPIDLTQREYELLTFLASHPGKVFSRVDLMEQVWNYGYVGDAALGERCNVGCGAVTVNYDRVTKQRTTVGDDAFIGCNSSLVAPVTLGDGAYIAAGSVITEDVPAQALGIARSRQSNKRDWAAKHKK